MSYLARLKQHEAGEIFHHTPKPEPTKPTKGASDGFVGSTPGAYENIHTENDADETGNKDDLIFQKVTRPLPTKPSEGVEYTLEDVAELDRLIERLCQLEPWLADALPEMQEARRCMAPANLAESLELFRGYVQAASGPKTLSKADACIHRVPGCQSFRN